MNGTFQSRLATQLSLGKVRLGAILGTLERNGLVSRKSEPCDRRIRRVFLTQKAWDVLHRIDVESERVADLMVEGVTPAERRKLVGALERIRGNLAPMLSESVPLDSVTDDLDEESEAALTVEQRLTVLTLGVDDIARSRHFYEAALGWSATPPSNNEVIFFRLGGVVLMIVERSFLAEDTGVPLNNNVGSVALTHVVRSRHEVDAVIAQAVKAGGRSLRPAREMFWGGYSGYFADPDGHAWEVAYTLQDFQLRVDGTMDLPATTAQLPEPRSLPF